MKLPTLKVNRRGSGSEQYPPKMMLALLIYCYANGIFSSRRIERATWRDVAVRFVTGDTHPDHDTICRFRRENFAAVSEAFLQVLQLARGMGVLKVGTVSVDGTHLKANASKDRNVRYDRAGELDQQLQEDIKGLREQHSGKRKGPPPKPVTERPSKTVKDPRLLAMQEKLRTDAGRALYALRQQTVEPVFGIIKSVLGFRQFLLRGLEKVSGEWDLVCLAYNVKRLGALQPA